MQLKRAYSVILCYLVILCLQELVISKDNKRVLPTENKDEKDVTFNTTLIDSELADVLWCGKARESVLAVTELGSVYYSSNSGMNWAKLSKIFQNSAKKQSSNNTEEIGSVHSLVQSPIDAQLVFFLGTSSFHWISEDCGKTIKALNVGRSIFDFKFHMLERNWALASTIRTCEDSKDSSCKLSQELYVSKDLGETWQFVIEDVIQFSWAVQNQSFLASMPKERVIIVKDLSKKESSQQGTWTKEVKLIYSDNFFRSKTSIFGQTQNFLITNDYFFALKVNDERSQDITLFVSDPKKYKFKAIDLPLKNELYDRSITILDASEGQVFLHVTHEGVRAKYGNIYISDSKGLQYSLSLNNTVKEIGEDICEIEKIAGLEGIFIANVYDSDMVEKTKDDFVGRVFVPKKKSQFGSSGAKSLTKRVKDLDKYKTTKISFDKGGMWGSLKAPKIDSLSKKIECGEKECSLHLHSAYSTRFGPLYSTNSSLGIILGTGNVGQYLSQKPDEINTYLSRDGGLSWHEVKKGSHIYEIGDHGAIIVMASDQTASKEIYYSWNEGLKWIQLKVSDTPIMVTDIITEPSNTGQKFIIYGRTSVIESAKATKGVLIGVNFSSLHERNCKLLEEPNDEKSDYETWRPGGMKSEDCLMGHQITYVRRKRSAECFNPEEFDRRFSYKNCECTEEDWECDVGYERIENGSCVLQVNRVPYFPVPEECVGFYNGTSGYRKVVGNTCEGGVNYEPIKVPCPPLILTKSNLLVMVYVAVAIFSLGFLIIKRHTMRGIFGSVIMRIANAKKGYYAPSKADRGKKQQTELIENINFEDNEKFGDLDDDFDFDSVVKTKRI